MQVFASERITAFGRRNEGIHAPINQHFPIHLGIIRITATILLITPVVGTWQQISFVRAESLHEIK